MAKNRPELRLPLAQNWSCHGTGACCRYHVVTVTQSEWDRIRSLDWGTDKPWGTKPPVQREGRDGTGSPLYRLAHKDDGSCIFLDDDGLCSIHRRFGLRAKPLACQLYPYVVVPLGKETRIGLRFSCPSVVANRGDSVAAQEQELRQLARELGAQGLAQRPPPPLVHGGPVPRWDWVLAYLDCAARFFQESPADLRLQCVRLLAWHGLVLATYDAKQDEGADWLDACAIRALREVDEDVLDCAPPGRLACALIRSLAARLGRRDQPTGFQGPLAVLRRTNTAVRTFLGLGRLPACDRFPAVTRSAVATVAPELDSAAASILRRYLRIKLWSGQFMGAANFGLSIHDGLLSLTVATAVLLWLARRSAAAKQRGSLDEDSVSLAVQAVDHHFGFDPVLASAAARFRHRWLWNSGQLVPLIVHGGDRLAMRSADGSPR